MTRRKRTHCPIAFALDVFGDPWTLLILRDLIFKRRSRYQDFLNSEEAISTNILADRLRRLEAEEIITKQDDPKNGKQYIYAPTKKGLDLVPVMIEVVRWSATYDAKTAAPKEFVRRLEGDRDGLIAEVLGPFSRLTENRRKRKG